MNMVTRQMHHSKGRHVCEQKNMSVVKTSERLRLGDIFSVYYS